MSQPCLAIIIPTYNRVTFLEENLDIIFKQASNFNLMVFVSDNCSTDATEAVCRKIATTHKNFFYNKNHRNLGFDKNLEFLINWSQGDYIWTLGDDDYLTEDSLNKLYEMFAKEPSDAYVLNGVERMPGGKISAIKSLRKDTAYSDINQITVDLWKHMTWMSSLVIKRSLLDGFNSKNFEESFFIHIQALYFALSKSEKLKLQYCSHPFISCPNEDQVILGYTPLSLYFFLDRWHYNLSLLPEAVSKKSKQICMENTHVGVLKFLKLRSEKYYTYDDFNKYRKFILKKSLLIAAFLIAVLPVWVSKVLMFLKNEIKKKLNGIIDNELKKIINNNQKL